MRYPDDAWALLQLPPLDQRVMWHYAELHKTWWLTYNEQAEALKAIGFVFADVFGDGIGSVASLTANGYDSPSPGDGIITRWEEADTGFLLPLRAEPPNSFQTFWSSINGILFTVDYDDLDTWPPAVISIPFLLAQNSRFRWGIAVRIAWGMAQVKCAACLANIWALDNRGRPVH